MRSNYRRLSGASESQHGFTLIELLVVITLMAVVMGLSLGVVGSVRERQRLTEAATAGRSVINAYLMHAADNGNIYMAARDETVKELLKADGSPVTMSEPRRRWPLRLAPYMQFQVEPALFTPEIIEYAGGRSGGGMSDYLLSMSPRFGMNDQFVGGTISSTGELNARLQAECITRPSEMEQAIIAFVSSTCAYNGSGTPGYWKVRPPREASVIWGTKEWTKAYNPQEFGYIDASLGGKVVCAYLDGAVRTHTMEELRDMRLWSKNALAADDPHYLQQP